MKNEIYAVAERIREFLIIAGDFGTILTVLILAYSAATSVLLWRSRKLENRYTHVYFPKNRDDFYRYYVEQIRKAKQSVYITSDGFNMRNSISRDAAKLMNSAQSEAICRGATVYRYQMTLTMHLNWLDEIYAMKRKHGDRYRTFINPEFETIGNFAVIDPGLRRAVTEFMLPDVGSIAQSTVARDYGFIHGHQAKARKAKEVFDRIIDDVNTTEVTDRNIERIRQDLCERRLKRYREEAEFHVFDEEIMKGIKKFGRNVSYEQLSFKRQDLSARTTWTPTS